LYRSTNDQRIGWRRSHISDGLSIVPEDV
jgi:hypothetical protein